MAFTAYGEYERFKKLVDSKKGLLFEVGCSCGKVTRLELNRNNGEYRLDLYGYYGISNNERFLFSINETQAGKQYNKRNYKYFKEYNILEYFPY
jgi:hypothetical protein